MRRTFACVSLSALVVAALPTPVTALPFAYITSNQSNSVSVIDTASNTVVATVPVGASPWGVAVNQAGTRVYVANAGSDAVSVIDTANNTLIATIPVGDGPEGIAVNPAGTRVYVSHVGLDTVRVIDTGSNSVVGVMPAGNFSANLTVSPDGARVYVTTANDNVVVLNAISDTLVTTIPVGRSPTGLVVNAAGTRLYVANVNGDNVSVVDTATNSVIATIDIDPSPTSRKYPWGVAINPAGTRLYVSNTGSVSVIDTATNSVVSTLSSSANSRGLDVTPDATRLYVVSAGNQVSAINLATGMRIASIPVGNTPVALGNFIGPATISTSTTTSSTTSTSTTATTSTITTTTSTTVTTTTSTPATTNRPATTTTTTTTATSPPCAGVACDDGDPCTSDLCSAGECVHQAVTGRYAVTCAFERPVACGGTPVPSAITGGWSRARNLATAAMQSSPARAKRLLTRSASILAKTMRRLGKLAQRRSDLMPSDCAGALHAVLANASSRVATCLATRCFAPTTTTTTLPPQQCHKDADCQDASLCNGLEVCAAGSCLPGSPALCTNGVPALWLGTATTSFGGYVNIGATLCAVGSALTGQFACEPGTNDCLASYGTITGTIVGDNAYYPTVTFADGSYCDFGGQVSGLKLTGTYTCYDPSGTLVYDYGTWSATRCP